MLLLLLYSVCVCVWGVHMLACVHACLCMMCTYMYACVHVCVQAHAHTPSCAHTCVFIILFTCVRACMWYEVTELTSTVSIHKVNWTSPRPNQRLYMWNKLVTTITFMGPRRLTFTWQGCCGLHFWHKPTLLVHSFYSGLVSISVFMALSTVFHSINSPDNPPLSRSVLSVLFLPCWSFQLYIYIGPFNYIYLFMKVSFCPGIILCGWLGLKHQLTHCHDRNTYGRDPLSKVCKSETHGHMMPVTPNDRTKLPTAEKAKAANIGQDQ